MQVRLRNIRQLRRDEYRMTLDLIDPARGPWEQGDCVVQVDLLDAPGQHYSTARGLLKPALEQYRMAPNEPPTTSEARLLWDMREAVNYYIDRIFEGGLLCPSGPQGRRTQPTRRCTALTERTKRWTEADRSARSGDARGLSVRFLRDGAEAPLTIHRTTGLRPIRWRISVPWTRVPRLNRSPPLAPGRRRPRRGYCHRECRR